MEVHYEGLTEFWTKTCMCHVGCPLAVMALNNAWLHGFWGLLSAVASFNPAAV